MVFSEEDLRPISALQHLLFCPRQCGLIHLEQQWAENALTVTGRHLHERVDGGKGKRRGGEKTKVTRSIALRSFTLGLFGRADVVEFNPVIKPTFGQMKSVEESVRGEAGAPTGPQATLTVPFPVEYKRGKRKKNRCDEVQLCAQALCLEEMFVTPVLAGAIYYGVTRRRVDIVFDTELRALTLDTISRLHEMMANRITPRSQREKKCDRCSLINLCVPGVLEGSESASRYVQRVTNLVLSGAAPQDGCSGP